MESASGWDTTKPTRRIVGALTSSFVGQQVLLLGRSISADAEQMKLKCTDGHVILVKLVNPLPKELKDPLPYVDIECVVENRNRVRAYKVNLFDKEDYEDFNPQLYNEMVTKMMSHGEANTFFITNAAIHISGVKDKTTA